MTALVGDALRALKIPGNGTILVHSSFRALGRDGHAPRNVIEEILNYMADGTVLMPAMSWRSVNRENPFFDQTRTPATTGVLSEIFRTEYAQARSLHPTHSVSGAGSRVSALLGSHHLDDTPCSIRSPFGLLADETDGWIALMGVGMETCTLVHHAEETVADDLYLVPAGQAETYTCQTTAGKSVQVRLRRHRRLRRNFWQFEDRLAAQDKIATAVVHNTTIRAFRAADLAAAALQALRADPACILVEQDKRYNWM